MTVDTITEAAMAAEAEMADRGHEEADKIPVKTRLCQAEWIFPTVKRKMMVSTTVNF